MDDDSGAQSGRTATTPPPLPASAIATYATAAVSLIALLAWGLSDEMGGVALAEWLSAVATLGTLSAAVLAGTFAFRALKIEGEREARHIDAIESEQASRVAAWFDFSSDGEADEWMDAATGRHMFRFPHVIRVVNASPTLIYQVTATLKDPTEVPNEVGRNPVPDRVSHTVRWLPPGTSEIPLTSDSPLGHWYHARWQARQREELYGPFSDLDVAIEFHDGSNRRWRRGYRGELLRAEGLSAVAE